MRTFYTSQFKKDYKKICSMGYDKRLLEKVINLIANNDNEDAIVNNEVLTKQHRNHKLSGNYSSRWECHIKGNWLLIYKVDSDGVTFERTGTHSQLF